MKNSKVALILKALIDEGDALWQASGTGVNPAYVDSLESENKAFRESPAHQRVTIMEKHIATLEEERDALRAELSRVSKSLAVLPMNTKVRN